MDKLTQKGRNNGNDSSRETCSSSKTCWCFWDQQTKRTPDHPKKSHIVVTTKPNGDPLTIRFGQKGAKTAGKPKAGESDRMKKKRASFKARHSKNIAKGKTSAAYWADKVKW